MTTNHDHHAVITARGVRRTYGRGEDAFDAVRGIDLDPRPAATPRPRATPDLASEVEGAPASGPACEGLAERAAHARATLRTEVTEEEFVLEIGWEASWSPCCPPTTRP